MKPYTNTELLSTMKDCILILDEPVKPCFCRSWERCRCKENALIQQMNEVHNLLENSLYPNKARTLERHLAQLAEIERNANKALQD